MEEKTRLADALADRYRLEEEVGSGGMATVYLAQDLKHDRRVAVKVLRPELAAVLGAERFLSEIKTTANLQHPHILPLFDSGEADGFLFYVMPYVEGESLRDRLDREKQLPVDEAVSLGKSVASALDYAHRQGVIHRDIKPANILLHDGQPMVADFGIALAVTAAGGSRLTETGLSLGTPHYMSPEQATGDREVDGRSDLYSLGATLYEMLAGRPPFTGASAQAIVAKILTEKPTRVSQERSTVPPHVGAVIEIALAKLPADRFQSAAEFGEALADPTVVRSMPGAWKQEPGRGARFNGLSAGLFVLVLFLAAAAAWGWMREFSIEVSQFGVTLPQDSALIPDYGPSIALSPDGSRMAYVGPGPEGGKAVWVKELDELAPRMLSESEGAFQPFFSPDGQWVGFIDEGDTATVVKVVSVVGEPPRVLADSGVIPHGASWGVDGNIYISGGRPRVIVKVPQDGGGVAETVTHLKEDETDHMWPSVLPNGRGLLINVMRSGAYEYRDADVAVVDLETGEHHVLFRGAMPLYAKSGHLIFMDVEGGLFAAPFDQDRLRHTGDPVAIAEGVAFGNSGGLAGGADIAVSENGTFLYVSAAGEGSERELVWVRRDGTEELVDPQLRFSSYSVSISPLGNRIAIWGRELRERGTGVWVYDLDSGLTIPLEVLEGSNEAPFWHPDGRRVTFYSDRGGIHRVFSKVWDNSEPAEPLVTLDRSVGAGEWALDGSALLLQVGFGRSGPTGRDVVLVRPGVDGVPEPFYVTEDNEGAPAVSPNGAWVAYEARGVEPFEIFVRPLSSPEPTWPVSSGGGRAPRWARDGSELFFVSSDSLVAVEVETSPTFSPRGQRALFSFEPYKPYYRPISYDVAADGRFLMIRQRRAEVGRLVRVTGFFELLRRHFGS
jgi:serine/threonine-protein kinase